MTPPPPPLSPLTEHRHPTVIEILILLRKLERKGLDIIFSWVPGHVGILGNEQADTAARSMSDHMQRPVCYQDLKTSTQNYIHRVWQETWDQQILNKLHSIHPSTSHWAALPVRRHDVRLTRLRIGHTRFTHRQLLLGENAPECPSCKSLDIKYVDGSISRYLSLIVGVFPILDGRRPRQDHPLSQDIVTGDEVPRHKWRILFSDEAHFWLNGYVNKQNCRIWSEANPQVYVETPLHPEKLTVWCALWAGGIIGPYFFKNDEGHNVTVNGDRYRAMITNFFIPELNNHDVQELWFQQDGATCHTARATIDLLKDTFGDRLISRFGPVNWPPRSCDLTPLDYFLRGYVKSLVYADKPQTLDHLEDNIRRVIADIRPQMLEKVIENWTSRLDYIRASRGSHMPEIIFKM
ncbi:putative RNA-directed DNA polymerase from transposon BS [Trichonephila clavipes]|nr:putative RNA-directed DNA polymerase from transposon BS [Trichonephila clavipes]